MGRKKENTPKNIKRYTIQMDKSLYRDIRMSALALDVKTYELMNRVVILGIEVWSKLVKSPEAKIDVKSPVMTPARELMNKIIIKEK